MVMAKRKRKSVSPEAEADTRKAFDGLAKVAGTLKDWKPAGEVLTKVRAVPTIFPQFDRATRCGGYPIERVTVVHGPSGEGKTIFAHGLGLSFLKRGHFYAPIDAEFCYDGETEVLTERGFVRWPDVSIDDRLGCWDPAIESLVYEKPLALTVQHYRGKMYQVDHSKVDLVVTPGHKMYVRRHSDKGRSRGNREVGWKDWSLAKAKDIRYRARYKKHAVFRVADPVDLGMFPPVGDRLALLALIGFAIGDGWVAARRGCRNKIKFTLKKKRKVAFLKEQCSKVGWVLEKKANNVWAVCADNIGELFRVDFYDAGKKVIPDYLMMVNKKEADSLLLGLRNSDGSTKRKTWVYSTVSWPLAESVQRIVIHAGGCAHIGSTPQKKTGWGVSPFLYRVTVLTKPEAEVKNKRDVSMVEYDGPIYCAHTRTGIMMVRRNGKPVLSGNTSPEDWLRKLLGEQFGNPAFLAQRPTSYEQAVNAVRELVKAVGEGKKKGELSQNTSALVVVDSIRKLVPEDFLAKIRLHGADGKKGSVDGSQGRGGQLKAKMNAEWLDELIPMLYETGTGLCLMSLVVWFILLSPNSACETSTKG